MTALPETIWQTIDRARHDIAGYERYANSSYAEFSDFKLFYQWDTPHFTPAEIQALSPPPDYVIYQ